MYKWTLRFLPLLLTLSRALHSFYYYYYELIRWHQTPYFVLFVNSRRSKALTRVCQSSKQLKWKTLFMITRIHHITFNINVFAIFFNIICIRLIQPSKIKQTFLNRHNSLPLSLEYYRQHYIHPSLPLQFLARQWKIFFVCARCDSVGNKVFSSSLLLLALYRLLFVFSELFS